jgi:hypothetical protein
VTDYVVYPFDSEPPDLLQDVYDYIQARIPTWVPSDGNLDVMIAQAFVEIAADLYDISRPVPDSIFRYLGATVFGIQPTDATPARVDMTWTMKDNAGYLIPAGSSAGVRDANGDLQVFETLVDVTVPPGSTVTGTGAVTGVAVAAGAASSGLGGVGATMEQQSSLEYVTSITMTAATYGGVDAEADDDYLNRLRSRLQLLTPTPILPADFAAVARLMPTVGRSVAIDGLIPPSSTGNDRAVAVAVTDVNGNALSTPAKADVDTFLQSLREVNFIVSVFDPTYTNIDVAVKVHPKTGYSGVDTAVVAALNTFSSPATWGMGDDSGPQDWNLTTVVRYLEVAEAINRVDGVDYITTTAGNFDLTIGVHGGALARTDIALTGQAPLTTPGTMTVTLG